MNKLPENLDPMFVQLVLSLQASAMQQMGKVVSALTGKIERDIPAAQFTIDILTMLEKKMAGNLSEEEAKLMSHVLYELRLNFVDESKKVEPDSESSSGESAEKEEADQKKEKAPVDQEKAETSTEENSNKT